MQRPSQPAPEPGEGARAEERGVVVEFRNPDHPWPDKPEIPELVVRFDERDNFEEDPLEPPEDIDGDNSRMLRRQCLYRWAAQLIAVAMNGLPEITKVAAFGSVARPLKMEVPRFRRYRRHRIEIYHECRDLDLAVWTTELGNLRDMKKALQRGVSVVQDTEYGGVAHHQVDVHVFDAATGDYRGRLCIFGQCPKGKRECLAPGCGDRPFLQQFERYRFNPARFAAEPKVTLVDKAAGFVMRLPGMDAKPARIEYGDGFDSDDDPF